MTRNAIAGGVLWIALTVVVQSHLFRLTIIEVLFLLGPLVVVPLGLELRARQMQGDMPNVSPRLMCWLHAAGALCVIVSFRFEPGKTAAAFALPWLMFGLYFGLAALLRILRGEFRTLQSACVIMSFLYLPVGCAWLVASRLGLGPMGFQEPIVLLTAVHFHFAGFAAPLMALAAAKASERNGAASQRLLRAVIVGVLAGPGLLAAGFVIGPRLKLAAALVIACSEVGLALFFLAGLRSVRPRLAQLFISISAASVLVAMLLAGAWAIGEFPLQPFVHLDQMARFHGTANALGFVLCGLVGWTIAGTRAPGARGGVL
jgi:hypothetical protein